jgi:alanine-synthesizing transaminase
MKLKRLEQGEEVADLSMLNPDMAPPRFLLDKLMEACAKPYNHRYAVSRGVRRLREAFAEKYQARFGVSLHAESEVCATMGTKDAVLQALRVLCAPKDRVLCVSPVYPAYRSLAALHGLELCTVKLEESEEGTTNALCRAIESLRPKVVLLNFPHNPTGAVMSLSFWNLVRSHARSVGSVVLNDFVYGELLHSDGCAVSALSGGGDFKGVVESYSLSKAYNVPGWRVGALVGDARIVEQVSRVKSHVDYGIFLPVQLASASALEARENLTLASSAEYRARAQVLSAGLKRCGFTVTEPKAGGSLWAKGPQELSGSGSVLAGAEMLLSRAGILAAPGVLYGEEWSAYLRFALVQPPERLRDACHRIAEVEGGVFHA